MCTIESTPSSKLPIQFAEPANNSDYPMHKVKGAGRCTPRTQEACGIIICDTDLEISPRPLQPGEGGGTFLIRLGYARLLSHAPLRVMPPNGSTGAQSWFLDGFLSFFLYILSIHTIRVVCHPL